jgi:hypothetical protein
MDDGEILIPLAAIFCIFGLPVLAWVFFRVMAHRERMEMLRQGLLPNQPEMKQRWATATPVTPGRPVVDSSCAPFDANHALRKGITLTMIGFAITLGLSFIGLDGPMWHPGPWLLGGLVPLFVGLAQVIIALMSGATMVAGQTWGAAPSAPPPHYTDAVAPPGPATYDGSYTYRPGSTQELRPPSPPPERR